MTLREHERSLNLRRVFDLPGPIERMKALERLARGRGEVTADCPHIGVYYQDFDVSFVYHFFLSMSHFPESVLIPERSRFLAAKSKAELLTVKRVPFKWRTASITEYLGERQEKDVRPIELGYIVYSLVGMDFDNARTTRYYPKSSFNDLYRNGKLPQEVSRSILGLPYFIEAVTTSHLAKPRKFEFPVIEPVIIITTTKKPSAERRKQLKKIGLPVNRSKSPEAWLKGLGRGIREATLAIQEAPDLQGTS